MTATVVRGPSVHVYRGRTYGGVTVDLWPTRYDLSHEGSMLVTALIRQAIQLTVDRHPRGRKEIVYSSVPAGGASATIIFAHGVDRDLVPGLRDGLVAIMTDARYLLPLEQRWNKG